MAIKPRSGIAVGLNKGRVCLVTLYNINPSGPLPLSKSGSRSLRIFFANRFGCHFTESHPPGCKATNFSHQGSSKQAHCFRSGDCEGGRRVCNCRSIQKKRRRKLGKSRCSGVLEICDLALFGLIESNIKQLLDMEKT